MRDVCGFAHRLLDVLRCRRAVCLHDDDADLDVQVGKTACVWC